MSEQPSSGPLPGSEPAADEPTATVPEPSLSPAPEPRAPTYGAPAYDAPPLGAPPAAPRGIPFFDRVRGFGAVRSTSDRWGAGVCAALARRQGIDPVLVRGLTVALTFVFGAGILFYGIGWLLLPDQTGQSHLERAVAGRLSAGFFGAGIVTIIGLSSLGRGSGPFVSFGGDAAGLAALALIAAVIWWAVSRPSAVPRPGTSAWPPPPAYGPRPTGSVPMPAAYGPTPPGSAPMPDATGGLPAHPPVYPSTYPSAGAPGAPTSAPQGAAWSPFASDAGAPTVTPQGQVPVRTWTPPPAPPAPPVPWTPPDRPSRTRSSRTVTLAFAGTALIVAAGLMLAHRWGVDVAGYSSALVAGSALVVISLGLVTAGVIGRRGGGLVPLAIVLLVVTLAHSGGRLDGRGTDHVGDVTWTPAVADITQYDQGAGNATLDLTDPGLAARVAAGRPVDLTASLGVGEMTIIVPRTLHVTLDLSTGLGEISVPGTSADSGPGLHRIAELGAGTTTSGTTPGTVTVDASVGLGAIHVRTTG